MKGVETVRTKYTNFSGAGRKFLKRKLARLERREGKRLLEDAPKVRMTRGWCD